jgi:hypothetical protein
MTMAVAGEVEYLPTGDHRAGLLQRGHVGRTRIVMPTNQNSGDYSVNVVAVSYIYSFK